MNSIKLDRRIFETDIVNNTKLPICYAIMLTEPCGLFKNSENKAKYFYRTSIRFLSERFYKYGIKNITTIDIKNILIETTNKNTQLQDISVSGGVVDSYKAVQKAEELYKKIENK